MNDCIEREKAIELIQPHVKLQTVYGKGYLQAIQHATDILELMPAADVQPVKRGKWIGVDYDTYFECSECKHMTDWQLYKYCPYCGARMMKDGDAE